MCTWKTQIPKAECKSRDSGFPFKTYHLLLPNSANSATGHHRCNRTIFPATLETNSATECTWIHSIQREDAMIVVTCKHCKAVKAVSQSDQSDLYTFGIRILKAVAAYVMDSCWLRRYITRHIIHVCIDIGKYYVYMCTQCVCANRYTVNDLVQLSVLLYPCVPITWLISFPLLGSVLQDTLLSSGLSCYRSTPQPKSLIYKLMPKNPCQAAIKNYTAGRVCVLDSRFLLEMMNSRVRTQDCLSIPWNTFPKNPESVDLFILLFRSQTYSHAVLGKVWFVICCQFQALPRRRFIFLLAQHASAVTHLGQKLHKGPDIAFMVLAE